MPTKTRIVAPGPTSRSVRTSDGRVLKAPDDWQLLPPGDAGLTRRVKASGPTWTVKEKKGRRVFSRGVWAPADRIAELRSALEAERSTEAYAKRRASATARRAKHEQQYSDSFRTAVLTFLNFAPAYSELGERLADAVAAHATPVGSGTVARTQRIPVEQRAESAVIAWLRHQTTAYDKMKIARVRGKRREVRRMLADQSRQLLAAYRHGRAIDADCPLRTVLTQTHARDNDV